MKEFNIKFIKNFLIETFIVLCIFIKNITKFWFRFTVILAKALFKTSLSASVYIVLTILLVTGVVRPRTYTLVVLLIHSFDLAIQFRRFTASE